MKKIISCLSFIFVFTLNLAAQEAVEVISSGNNSEVVALSDNEKPVLPADTVLTNTDWYKNATEYRNSALQNESYGEYIQSYDDAQSGIQEINKLKGEVYFIVMPYRIEKMRIDSENAINSYREGGYNTNALTRSLYAFSITNYNSATNLMEVSKTITNDRASLSNNYNSIVSSFTECLDVNTTIASIMKVDEDRNSLIKNKYLAKNDTNNTLVSSLLQSSSEAYSSGDKNTSKAKVDEADKLVSGLKEKHDADIAYAYAYATIKYLEKNHKNKTKTPEYTNAMDSLYNAYDRLNENKYKDSIEESKKVIQIVDGLANFTFILPQSYTVVKRDIRTDTLWRIASYDFIYKNRKLWNKLYDANKETFIEPQNPNLIEKDQVLLIPNLSNELREGMYDSKKKYIILSTVPPKPAALPKR